MTPFIIYATATTLLLMAIATGIFMISFGKVPIKCVTFVSYGI